MLKPSSNALVSKRTILIAAFLHALLSVAVVPGVGLFVTAFVAVAPLAWLAALLAKQTNAEPANVADAQVKKPRVKWWHVFGLVWLACVFKELVHHWWVLQITPLGLPPLLAIMACWPALFVVLLARVQRSVPKMPLAISAALLWTMIEVFRGEWFADGYRWSLLALPLVHAPFFKHAGSVLGVYGAGTLLALVGGAAAMVLTTPRSRSRLASLVPFALSLTLFAGVAAVGSPSSQAKSVADSQASPPSLRVTLLQTNVSSSNKVAWSIEEQITDFLKFDDILAYAAAASKDDKPDLYMWPETMAPGGPIHPDVTEVFRKADVVIALDPEKARGLRAMGMWEWADQLGTQQARLGAPVLIGDDVPEGFRAELDSEKRWDFRYDKRFNSMLLIDGGKVTRTRYDKVLRTPFGEYMPIIGRFTWLKKQLTAVAAPGMSLDLSAGEKLTRFAIPVAARGSGKASTARIATPICFEITSPTHCRALAFEKGKREADVLANPTNDGWFGDSLMGKLMHLEHAQWRSLELATPMVRPANTGLSCMIDDEGNVQTMSVTHVEQGEAPKVIAMPHNVDGYLTVNVPFATRTTLYAKLGNLPAWSITIAGGVLCVMTFVRKRVRATN